MGKVGGLEMRRSRKGGRCTFPNWHLINLTCSQVERKTGSGGVDTHTPTPKEKEREEWTAKWSEMYRKEMSADGLYSRGDCSLTPFHKPTYALSISCSTAHRQRGRLRQHKIQVYSWGAYNVCLYPLRRKKAAESHQSQFYIQVFVWLQRYD